MLIHREGYRTLISLFLFLAFVLFILARFASINVGDFYTIGFSFLVFFLLVLQFFRNPKPATVVDPRHVLAPADGRVVVIEQIEEPEYLKDKRIQVSIFMSPLNVHVNRNPVSGKVSYFKYHPGKYLVAWHPKSSTENERTTSVVELPDGVQILFRQIAGALARRICWYIKVGDEVMQGDEFGFIKFGSRVDVFLPLNALVKVKINDITAGGQTIIAELPQ